MAIDIDTSIGPIGAVISGVDLSHPLEETELAELKSVWYQHGVLFFPEQNLQPNQQAAFAQNFGELDIYPFVEAIDENAHVIPIIKEADAAMNFGGGWHTDTSYLEVPPMATILCGVEIPDEGGDTLFADCSAAFEALSPAYQTMLLGLTGVYSPKLVHGSGGAYSQVAARSNEDETSTSTSTGMMSNEMAVSEVEHPLIRRHPETGRHSIYCGNFHTHRIKGWTREESVPLILYLNEWLQRPEFVTRFKWSTGAVALWDNRSLFHNALNDYQGKRRHMNRVIVKGDRP